MHAARYKILIKEIFKDHDAVFGSYLKSIFSGEE